VNNRGNIVLRGIVTIVAIFSLVVVTPILFEVADPLHSEVNDSQALKNLGWAGAENTAMQVWVWAAGILGVVFLLWFVLGPLKDDQFGGRRRPPR